MHIIEEIVEDALRHLADEAEQRRSWLASHGPEVYSWAEATCHLWDDSGLSSALDRPGVTYSVEIDERLRQLHELMRRVDSERSPQDILGDPLLPRIRDLAARLLKDLREFAHEN